MPRIINKAPEASLPRAFCVTDVLEGNQVGVGVGRRWRSPTNWVSLLNES